MATAATVPMMNPTGTWGAGNFNTGGVFNTATGFATPGTGGPGNYNYGNAMNPNAVFGGRTAGGTQGAIAYTGAPTGAGATTTTPTTGVSGATGTAATTATQNPFGMSPSGSAALQRELGTYYGQGMGNLLYQYLMSGGGLNTALTQQTIDAQTNAMQQQMNLGANNLATRLGAAGISPSSSVYSGEMANYMQGVTSQEQAMAAQQYYNMWSQSQQNELSVLQSVAGVNATGTANQSNWMDYLGDALGIAGSVTGIGLGVGMMNQMGMFGSHSSVPQMDPNSSLGTSLFGNG